MPRAALLRRIGLALAVIAALAAALYLGSGHVRTVAQRVAVWSWQLNYWAFPVDEGLELRKLHVNARDGSRAQCVSCHGDKSDSKLALHRIHLHSELFSEVACHECHPRVELARRDNRTLVTWVDVAFCKKCHSDFPGEHAGSKMKPADYEADCIKCHSGDSAPRHEPHYLPRKIAASQCKGCHGGRALPWTAGHEAKDWLRTHGKEALESGTEACYQCHDFGMKFCEDCHGTKPPSHLPAESWRIAHVAEARADTRVCYTCHRTSFCKQCHLNHEDGWMGSHPDFVRLKGDTSCRECHSLSACGFCHTASASDGS